jgi:hypothetical protein
MKLSESLMDIGEGFLNGFLIGNIHLPESRIAAVSFNLVDHFSAIFIININDSNAGTFTRQESGGRFADSSRTPGNNSYFIFNSIHYFPPYYVVLPLPKTRPILTRLSY